MTEDQDDSGESEWKAQLSARLALEEYKSLRVESVAAKSNQQSTLQWSMASIAVVVGGSVAAMSSSVGYQLTGVTTVVTLVLAVLVPIIIAGAFGVWLGEVERMERVGHYLRKRERETWRESRISMSELRSYVYPVAWENAIHTPKKGDGLGKNWLGSVAAILIFAGFFTLSLAAATSMAWNFTNLLKVWQKWVLSSWSLLSFLCFVTFFGRQLLLIRQGTTDSFASESIGAKVEPDLLEQSEIDVILPCLNEAAAIPRVLLRLPQGFRAVIADNGSMDGSRELGELLGASVLDVVRRGVGAASIAGVKAARSDIVCVADCDGSVDLALLPQLVERILTGDADMVIATRVFRHGSANLIRRTMFRGSGLIASWISGVEITDLGSLRAFRRDLLLRNVHLLGDGNGWSIDLLRIASASGARIETVALPYLPRIGKSKITGTMSGALSTIAATLNAVAIHLK